MNHVYRLVWNQILGSWVAVSETARGRSKNGKGSSKNIRKKRAHRPALFIAALIPAAFISSLALAADLPTGGTVVVGSGTISQNGSTLTVIQGSDKLITNWQGFNIGAGNTVNFVQPSSSAVALNRVTGSDASQIYGTLTANGRVFLINPNGVLFGRGAQVDVGGLVASTLNIRDSDFLAGNYVFSGTGGNVSNAGTLRAKDSGAIALLGGKVSNDGIIEARLGTVALAAGGQITLDFAGDGLLNVKVSQSALDALVENRGAIRANGGSVLLTADAGEALLQTVVNNTGLIEAQTVENREGKIVLLGGFDGGTVTVSGTLDASAPGGGNGGFIETSGAHVKVSDSAFVTTKANTGKNGTWLIDPNDFTIAASGGDMTGTAVGNALANGNFIIQTATMGTAGGHGDINVNDTVSWSQNILTLNAERNINVNATINAKSTAGLALEFNQGDAGGNYYVYAPINLASTGSFSTKSGSAGGTVNWTIITSLGAEGSTSGTDLQGINGNFSGNYVLGADIDASTAAAWNGGKGFHPLGDRNIDESGFTGNFDGLGHVIDGLTINNPNTRAGDSGLFAYASGGTLSNVGLTHVSLQGSIAAGGLVGRSANLTIRNSYVTGSVSASAVAGGVVGYDIFPRGSSSLINVYSSADVTATTPGTGSGTLIGIAGGLVGGNVNLVENSYSTGQISGGNYVGGLVGYANEATVKNSYFAGTVTVNGTPHTSGAILGGKLTDVGNVLTNVHWNTDLTGTTLTANGNSASAVLTNASGLTTAQMRDAANWTGFTFTTTPGQGGWVLLNGVLPMLASEWSPVIRNVHQLQLMTLDKSASYTLANHLDASATNGKDVWLDSGFLAVGDNSMAFIGSLDGRGYSISGLTLNRSGSDWQGLIGKASGATLANLSLLNTTVSGSNYVGALLGQGDASTTVSDVHASGSVSGASQVGGLVGEAHAAISGSSASSTVTGGSYVGGLVGATDAGVADSSASGHVNGTADNVGGLVGWSSAGIRGSNASGDVSGRNSVGGLAGWTSGSVTDSNAGGTVGGVGKVGGLVGEAQGAISGSHATGAVTGSGNFVGGLVGKAVAVIDDSYATGAVSGTTEVGGLVGYGTNSVSNSHATGAVSGASNVGGLVGLIEDLSHAHDISNSYASGAVTGVNSSGYTGNLISVGGLVGHNYGASISLSYASGTVSGTITGGSGDTLAVGGLVGHHNNAGSITQSYATGTVTANSNSSISGIYVGGLAGYNDNSSAITQSYAAGNVSGTNTHGGNVLAGGLAGLNDAHASVSESLSTGSVSGTSNATLTLGGLVGANTYGATVDTSFFATTNAAGNAINSGLDVVGTGDVATDSSGKTQVALKNLATFTDAGWDITGNGGDATTWRIYDGQSGPLLRGFLTQKTVTLTPDYDGSGNTLSQIGSVTVSGVDLSDPHLLGNATVTGGDTLTLTGSGTGGSYTATSNATLGNLYSDQQGYDITVAGGATRTVTTAGSTAGEVQLPGALTWTNGTLVIDTAGSITTVNAGGANTTIINGDGVKLTNGNWNQIGTTLAGFTVNDFQLAGGTFLRVSGGSGTGADPYLVSDVYGLQGMASTALLSQHFALANDVDASATASWNGGAGFVSVGKGGSEFSGSFDGQGHSINGLSINRSAQDEVGLFGATGTGSSLSNVTLTNASVQGNFYVGALVGSNEGTINNVSVQGGTVHGEGAVGGLVGASMGAIADSNASAAVTGSNTSQKLGGLAGYAGGTVSGSHATGVVSGGSEVGGLLGDAAGAIRDSYATGTVTGANIVGGLVGNADGNISDSHASGAVTGDFRVGGLVGEAYAVTISNSHALGAVTGSSSVGGLAGAIEDSSVTRSYALGTVLGGNDVGGLIGYSGQSSVKESFATGQVTANGGSGIAGGLVGYNGDGSSILQSYATGNVAAANGAVGGLVGTQYSTASIDESYASGAVSGSAATGGLVGDNQGSIARSFAMSGSPFAGSNTGTIDSASGSKTAAELKELDTFTAAGWDIDDAGGTGKVWRIYDGHTGPLLRGFLTALTVTADSGSKTYDGTTSSNGLGLTYSATPDASLLGTASTELDGKDAGVRANKVSGLYSSQMGYDLEFVNGTVNINKANATVTANSSTVAYDGLVHSVAGYTINGLVNGENASVLDSVSESGGSGKNAGSYVHALSGTDNNYNLVFVDGGLTINKAPLSVTTGATNKTYDGTTAATGSALLISGTLYGSDSLSGGSFAYDDKNVGTGKTVTVSNVTVNDGNGGGNYDVSYVNNTSSSISKANLILSSSDVSKTYDGTTIASGTAVVTGGTQLFAGDSLSGGSFAYDDKNVGTGKTVTVSNVTVNDGNGGGNYDVSYVNNTSSSISKANLILSSSDVSKTYDGTTIASGTAVVTGGTQLFAGDSLSGGSFAYDDKNAGTGKTVAVSNVTVNDGNGGGNYDVSYVNNTSSSIAKANATVTANSLTVTYNGQTQSVVGYSINGLVNGEGESVLTGLIDNPGSGVQVGSYAHIVYGGTADNYNLTFVDGALRIVTTMSDNAAYQGALTSSLPTPPRGPVTSAMRDTAADALPSQADVVSIAGELAAVGGSQGAGPSSHTLTNVIGGGIRLPEEFSESL